MAERDAKIPECYGRLLQALLFNDIHADLICFSEDEDAHAQTCTTDLGCMETAGKTHSVFANLQINCQIFTLHKFTYKTGLLLSFQ